MKFKRHITYILLVVSLLMTAVPVLPHHHHANGLLCMKNDISTGCCLQHSDSPREGHCCCQTGCVAHHFFQQMPTDTRNEMQPAASEIIPFLSPLLLRLSDSLTNADKKQIPIYIESLHEKFTARATGLRAPPSTLLS